VIQEPEQVTYERAQLHADDINPDRRELWATVVLNAMLQSRTGTMSELPVGEKW
jgi:hypothetical protein